MPDAQQSLCAGLPAGLCHAGLQGLLVVLKLLQQLLDDVHMVAAAVRIKLVHNPMQALGSGLQVILLGLGACLGNTPQPLS